MTNANFTSEVKQPPFTMIDNGILQNKTIFTKATQKLCYMYLVSYSNCSRIFPSMPSIGEAICTSKRTAEIVIQELEEMGLIVVKRTKGKSNQYILKDYFEVANSYPSSEEISLAKKSRHTSEEISLVVAKKSRPITNTKNKKENNTSSSRESIIAELISKNPDKPVQDIANTLLEDTSANISTLKQFKSLLVYRIKNYQEKPATSPKKGTRKTARKEMTFDDMNFESTTIEPSTDLEAKKKAIEDKLRAFRG